MQKKTSGCSNRARQFTIATYQHIVYDEWMPVFLPRKFVGGQQIPYASNPGYSAYFNRTGYNPSINPQVAHVFQSAAMRFGHTMVTPGIWRRQLRYVHTLCNFIIHTLLITLKAVYLKKLLLSFFLSTNSPRSDECAFGSTLSADPAKYTNSFLSRIDQEKYGEWDKLINRFVTNFDNASATDEERAINELITKTRYSRSNGFSYTQADGGHFAIRTCNSFWNPQVTVSETNVDPFYLGMSSQATEREDTIITPDLRGRVFGPFDYNRRDLMAVNMQRARDHGLPDFNSARVAYGLRPLRSFEELNPLYGIDEIVTRNIEDLRDVYNNDISRCDIWACGLAETIPSDVTDPELQAISGPGELFTEVLFDQFMRIRHGDRFWWENYKNNG